jgi:hypothetical protein
MGSHTPCWEISRQTVNLKAAHTGFLTAAVLNGHEFENTQVVGNRLIGRHKATGYNFEIDLEAKTVSTDRRAGDKVANAINRSYSSHVVKTVAKRNGFSIENVTNGGMKFEIVA